MTGMFELFTGSDALLSISADCPGRDGDGPFQAFPR